MCVFIVANETVNHLFILYEERWRPYLSKTRRGAEDPWGSCPSLARELPMSQLDPALRTPIPLSLKSWPGCRHQLIIIITVIGAIIFKILLPEKQKKSNL